MWRNIAIFLVGGLLGTGFGVAVGFFAFPYVFPPLEVNEQLTDAERTGLVANGTFIHADPSDPIHFGKGGVKVFESTVFIDDTFEVGEVFTCEPGLYDARLKFGMRLENDYLVTENGIENLSPFKMDLA